MGTNELSESRGRVSRNKDIPPVLDNPLEVDRTLFPGVRERGGGSPRGNRPPQDYIQNMIDGSEEQRMHASQKMAKDKILPVDDLMVAKTKITEKLNASIQQGSKDISWITTDISNPVEYSTETAQLMLDIINNPTNADNPKWLTQQAYRLAASVPGDATSERRREVNAFIWRIREHIQTLHVKDFGTEQFDIVLYGDKLETSEGSPEAESVYKDTKTQEETINHPELVRLLRGVTRAIQTSGSLPDKKTIQETIKSIHETARYLRIPRAEETEAVRRLQELERQSITHQESARGMIVYRGDMYFDDVPVSHKKINTDPNESYYLSDEWLRARAERIKHGGMGALEEVFDEIIQRTYPTIGKAHETASFEEQRSYNEFINLVTWMYSPEAAQKYVHRFEYRWRNAGTWNSIMKNLLYTPGDPKEKLKAMQFLTPADFEHFMKNYEHANLAFSFYEDVVFDLLSEKQQAYQRSLSFLRDNNDAQLNRYFELKEMADRGLMRNHPNALALQQELALLQEHVDIVGYGVGLEDVDVQNQEEFNMEIQTMQERISLLEEKSNRSENEQAELNLLKNRISFKQASREQFQTINDRLLDDLQNEGMTNNHGLSRVEIEVKRRMRMSLGKDVPEWMINRAIWAARHVEIGSGRVATIGSQFCIRPAWEWAPFNGQHGNKRIDCGRYVMRSPAFEDLDRLYNPDKFADRFGMGDEPGRIFRAQIQIGELYQKGYVFRNDPKYRRNEEAHLDPNIRIAREFTRQIMDETGIPYTEIILNGNFNAGSIWDETLWRLDESVLTPQRKYYLRVAQGLGSQDGVRIDNQALMVQLYFKKKELNHDGKSGKQELLLRAFRRTPTQLLRLGGKEMEDVFRRHGITEGERAQLVRALSIAEKSFWQDEKNAMRDINLLADPQAAGSGQTDFDAFVRERLKQQGLKDEKIDQMQKSLVEIGLMVTNPISTSLQTRLAAISSHDMPLTLALSDFDMQLCEMTSQGTKSFDRRGADMQAALAARSAWFELQMPAMLFHKKPEETLKKLKEFHDAVNTYSSGTDAERATQLLYRAWFNMNAMRTPAKRAGWIPFAHEILNAVGMMNIDKNSLLGKIIGREKAHKIPERVRRFMSYATQYTGSGGNRFQEKEADHVFDITESMGMFFNTEFIEEMRLEYHANMKGQVTELIRKNWLFIPASAVAIGIRQAMEDEKKK